MGLTVHCFIVSSFLFVSAHSFLQIKDVLCPNGLSYCPEGNTCCDVGGTYKCCPSPNANCCPGTSTCCPSGTSCGPEGKKCYKSSGYTQPPIETFAQAKSKNDDKVRNIICPGEKVECNDKQTCCALANGGYGCCAYANATCCSDMKHCCPVGTVCGGNVCYKNDSKFLEPTSIQTITKMDKALNIICQDGGGCPDGNTCCPTSSGQYGCCPFPGASCCSDGQHCCRNGYECSARSQCLPSGSIHPIMTLI